MKSYLYLPCLNGGQCQTNGNSYICICRPEYTGVNCQNAVSSACSNNPCLNGATCVPNGDSYTCYCAQGFSGSNCASTSTNTGSCLTNNPCFNGGICNQNSVGLQSCQCQQGYTGTSCQYRSSCANSPCQSGATCVDQTNSGGTYYCQCTSGYYGRNCEYQISAQLCSTGDKDSTSCGDWSYKGFCSFSYTFNSIPVPVYCPTSCSICSSNQNSCQDQQTNCVLWKEMGFCNRINSMDANLCRFSCGNCN